MSAIPTKLIQSLKRSVLAKHSHAPFSHPRTCPLGAISIHKAFLISDTSEERRYYHDSQWTLAGHGRRLCVATGSNASREASRENSNIQPHDRHVLNTHDEQVTEPKPITAAWSAPESHQTIRHVVAPTGTQRRMPKLIAVAPLSPPHTGRYVPIAMHSSFRMLGRSMESLSQCDSLWMLAIHRRNCALRQTVAR